MMRNEALNRALHERSTLAMLIVPLLLIALVANLFLSSLVVDIYTQFAINLIIVLALQMFMGNSGILNWTHVGWFGIGAYMASIFSTAPMMKSLGVPNMYQFLVDIQMPVLPAILLGGVVAAVIAAIIAYPLMRLSDAVGVITLFATLIVIHVIMNQWDNVTNGPRTFFGVEQYTTMWIAVVGAALAIVIAHFFRESSLGLRLRASRDDRHAAAAMGVNVVLVRYLTFVLSALIAGVAGGVWAHYITSFSPKSFYIVEMFTLITMLVVGGSGSVSGAFMGTAIVTMLRELLRQSESTFGAALNTELYGMTELTMSVLLIIILISRPEGIVGGRELKWPRFRRKGRGDAADEVPQPDVA